MAVFLKHHRRKPTLILSSTERRLFVVITLMLILAAIWQLTSTRHQRQALEPLKQYQYSLNQACQQALNNGLDRNNRYCVAAQDYNQALTQTLKDQRIDLAESIKLEQFFLSQYQAYTE